MSGEAEHSFGAILRRARQAAGLTQEELAERAHLSVRGITDLERGVRRLPRKDTVTLLADALALSAGDRAAFAAAAHRHVQAAAGSASNSADARTAAVRAPGRGNLPLLRTTFVGRARECAAVEQLLAYGGLVTLTGAGGCGKTRLALEVAASIQPRYADGAWLVELAALSDPALVPQAVAQVLGVRERPEQDLLATLAEFLQPRHVLLLLDNCEHLVAACAAMIDALLRVCPRLTLLATSREPLGVPGEGVWRVPSLGLPDEHTPPVLAAGSAAAQLFVQRARQARQGFTLTEQHAALVAEICRRLDGMPLALELAAARLSALSLEQLAARLGDRFRLLTGGSRTALPRQQTLRATLDWSYDLLAEHEQALLRRLAVFAGGWTLEAAEAVGSGEDIARDEVLDLLDGLVHKSLVSLDDDAREHRYRLLETVRQYGHERLVASGEAERVRDRHLDWYLALAEQTGGTWQKPPDHHALRQLDDEADNLRGALDWSMAAAGRHEQGVRLTGCLGSWWVLRGKAREGRRVLEALLADSERAHIAHRARAWFYLAVLANSQGDRAAALAAGVAAEALYSESGDRRGTTIALLLQGEVTTHLGDHARAHSLLEGVLGTFRELGDQRGEGTTLCELGLLAHLQGNLLEAGVLGAESLALHRRSGNAHGVGNQLANLANIARDRGDTGRAWQLERESLEVRIPLHDLTGFAECFEGFGLLAAELGQAERAARLLAAAEAMREAIGRPVELADRVAHERMMATLPALLGVEAFAALWAEGRALPLDAAIAYAMENVP